MFFFAPKETVKWKKCFKGHTVKYYNPFSISCFTLQAVFSRGGVISRAVVEATAKTLVKRHPEYNLEHLNIEESSWSKSLFKRMGYIQRLATTG